MDALFFLSPVAEPDLHDVAIHAKTVRHVADLLGAWLWTRREQSFQRLAQQLVDVCSLLAASGRDCVERQRHSRRRPDSQHRSVINDRCGNRCSHCHGRRSWYTAVNVTEPFLKQRLQFAHVLEAEVESLKARNGRLREVISVQLAHRHADVTLRKTCSWRMRR